MGDGERDRKECASQCSEIAEFEGEKLGGEPSRLDSNSSRCLLSSFFISAAINRLYQRSARFLLRYFYLFYSVFDFVMEL